MNKAKIYKNRNEVADEIRMSNRKVNCFRWGSNETDAHIQRKLDICKWLKKQGKHFHTECIFKSGLRADVVSEDKIIFEVYNTEKEESLIRKEKNYPFEVRTVDANEKWNEKLCL